jgi:uncharacterized protein YndB with AHSA1/START domain
MAANRSGGTVEVGSIRRSAVLAAPVEAVWEALTEAGHLSAWLGGDVDVDPFPGGQIVVSEDGRLRRGVIVDVEPLRRLEIRWLPASRRLGFLWGPDEEPAGSGGGVEFRLEPVDAPAPAGGTVTLTRLTIVERAPASHPAGRPAALAVA